MANVQPRPAEPYQARSVRFLELWEAEGWRIKVYGIACRGSEPAEHLVIAAKQAARPLLPRPPVAEGRYGVGFMGVHEGRGDNLVFLDWWADENEIRHHVFTSAPAAPAALHDVTATARAACVWDLAVICFERQAWITSVLARPEAPDVDGYLRARLEGML